MDVLALSKANKAKKKIKELQDRLGAGVEDIHVDVKTRLEELEKKNPQVTLYNRVSDVEAHTAVNLNKHNLRMNAVVNKNRYGMSDLAFDDFGDDTGIDVTKSTGHVFDSAGKKVKINAGQTQAEIVTTAETLEADPQMMVVAQSGLVKDTDSKSVDLSGGTLVNAEVVDGKIQLKTIGELSSPTSYDNPGGKGDRQSLINVTFSPNTLFVGGYNDPKKLIDGLSTNTIYFSGGSAAGAYICFEFPEISLINEITWKQSGIAASGTWKWQGSLNGTNWEDIEGSFSLGTSATQVIMSGNSNAFKFYRLLGISGNTSTSPWLYDIEFKIGVNQNLYSPSGSYLSPILDLGENVKRMKKLDQLVDMPAGTNLSFSTATSSDGITFSDFAPVNPDGTIASPSARYLKVKAELTGGGETQEKLVHDFTAAERGSFESNEQILFDGSVKFKTQYSFPMEVDASFAETGTLLRKSVNKSSYKVVEKVQVI